MPSDGNDRRANPARRVSHSADEIDEKAVREMAAADREAAADAAEAAGVGVAEAGRVCVPVTTDNDFSAEDAGAEADDDQVPPARSDTNRPEHRIGPHQPQCRREHASVIY